MRGIEQYLQVDAATLGALKYAGTWNASTNTPTLASGVGTQGQYYVVSVAGSTNLDGETNWQVGDWAVFNGSVWQKVDGGSTGLLSTLTVTGNTYLATTSGDVGVGTSSPAAKLDVVGSLGIRVNEDAAGTKVIQIRSNFAGLGPSIQVSTADPLLFLTSNTERMRITSTGDVGIGTSSPAVKLDVANTSTTQLRVQMSGQADVRLISDTGYGALSVDSAMPLLFRTNATERMRIDSSGNVGIGTSSPDTKLRVAGTAFFGTTGASDTNLRIGALNATNVYLQANSYDGLTAKGFVFYNGGSLNMTLDASGNLGLGVTPSAWGTTSRSLTVNAGAFFSGRTDAFRAHLGLNAYESASDVWRYSATLAASRYTQIDGQHQWFNAPSGTAGNTISFTQAMTLDASGNLGIGTSSPGAKLDVAGAARVQGDFFVYGTGDRFNVFPQTAGNGVNVVSTNNANSAYAQLTLDGVPLIFKVAGTERMRITSAGDVGIGTSSPSYTLDVRTNVSNAIRLGSSSNAFGSLLSWDNPSGEARLMSIGAYALVFGTNTTERMRLDTSGNVGIGTTSISPAYGYTRVIEVAGQFPGIKFSPSGASTFGFQIGAGTNGFQFYDVAASTERMRIDTSGNLGLGVTPSAWISAYRALDIGNTASVYGRTDSSIEAALVANAYRNSAGNWIYKLTGIAGRFGYDTVGSWAWFTAPSGTAGNAISFTQAMTLDASGNLLVGKTTASGTTVGPELLANGQINAATANLDNLNIYNTTAAAYRFYVNAAGSVFATNTAISAISDQRLKENVQDLDAGLDKIMALKPRKFDWKAGKGKDIKGDRGFIAQEFEQVFPDLIDEWKGQDEGEDPYKSVRQDLIPVLVKAIQELKAEVDSLKAQLGA